MVKYAMYTVHIITSMIKKKMTMRNECSQVEFKSLVINLFGTQALAYTGHNHDTAANHS